MVGPISLLASGILRTELSGGVTRPFEGDDLCLAPREISQVDVLPSISRQERHDSKNRDDDQGETENGTTDYPSDSATSFTITHHVHFTASCT